MTASTRSPVAVEKSSDRALIVIGDLNSLSPSASYHSLALSPRALVRHVSLSRHADWPRMLSGDRPLAFWVLLVMRVDQLFPLLSIFHRYAGSVPPPTRIRHLFVTFGYFWWMLSTEIRSHAEVQLFPQCSLLDACRLHLWLMI